MIKYSENDNSYCIACGSRYFVPSSLGKSCRHCGHVKQTTKGDNKMSIDNTETLQAFVVSSPQVKISNHNGIVTRVPDGKHAICIMDYSNDGELMPKMAKFGMFFDDREMAEKLAKSVQMSVPKRDPKLDMGLCEPTEQFELITEDDNVRAYDHSMFETGDFDLSTFGEIDLDELVNDSDEQVLELTEEMRIKDEQKYDNSNAIFFCDECSSHLTVNLKRFPDMDRHILSCPRKKVLDGQEVTCNNVMTREDE